MKSNRKYTVAYHLDGLATHKHDFTLNELVEELAHNDCSELFYSLEENMDRMLDLKIGESLYFMPNRDIHSSKAILVRTN